MSEPARGTGAGGLLRPDLSIIAAMIPKGTRVLDLGCGEGELLYYLVHEKGVDGRGIELSQAGVNACVSHGLSVIQGDVDTDLEAYPDAAFDVVILSQTLPAVRRPREVLRELLRIGRRTIVSFPNVGSLRRRLYFLLSGRVPASENATFSWFDTPYIRPCTIKDFVTLCEEEAFVVERRLTLDAQGRVAPFWRRGIMANLLGENAVFVLSRRR